ncbi:hypothetical protein LOAG_02667 [Loa loa]|uniref:Uncharacterized protein n=1 Tax=Loa loa TaxID=7209 RepID=A0A1S0U675_LOALO|nr:hypothetical protein LOAG_02667 [Loa loa]EFO25815.1 hypothetical protein LOAG_02667 [Loa loa]
MVWFAGCLLVSQLQKVHMVDVSFITWSKLVSVSVSERMKIMKNASLSEQTTHVGREPYYHPQRTLNGPSMTVKVCQASSLSISSPPSPPPNPLYISYDICIPLKYSRSLLPSVRRLGMGWWTVIDNHIHTLEMSSLIPKPHELLDTTFNIHFLAAI